MFNVLSILLSVSIIISLVHGVLICDYLFKPVVSITQNLYVIVNTILLNSQLIPNVEIFVLGKQNILYILKKIIIKLKHD